MTVPSSDLGLLSRSLSNVVDESAASRLLHRRIFRVTLLASDVCMLGIGFYLAFWMRFKFQLSVAPEVEPSTQFYGQLAVILIPIWIGLFFAFGLYSWGNLLGGTVEYARTFHACTVGMLLVILATFFEPDFVVARGWLLFLWMFSVLQVCLARFWLRRVVYSLRTRGYFLTPTAVVGTNQEALALVEQLDYSKRNSGLQILGLINGNGSHSEAEGFGLPVLGPLTSLEAIIQEMEIENLVVSVTALDRRELLHLHERISALRGVELRLSSGLYEVLTTGVSVRTFGSVPLISLNRLRLEPAQLVLKTLMEYSLTVLGLIVLSPILATIGLLIKLDNPGPVFHRRRVLGLGGKEFDAFKFRTMQANGDQILAEYPELAAQLQEEKKLKEDPRITRVGLWLRKCSFDELPQLFNVLLGQMSLVGPRMIAPEEGEMYGRLKWNLLTVKPGITGLWQVSGRSDLSYEERVRLDMHYIRNYTIWTDLKILFIETPVAVLRRRGAY